MTVAQSTMTLGPGGAALRVLSPSQIAFLERLPKAELHAHLNGSIPFPVLQELAHEYVSSLGTGDSANTAAAQIRAEVQRLQAGITFNALEDSLEDFFKLFSAIYALTSTPASLKRATRGVLSHFLDPPPPSGSTSASAPQANGAYGGGSGGGYAAVTYLELRTTPRETAHMTRRVYLETVLDEIEARPPDAAALIVSIDRRMTPDLAREMIELALQLHREGRRVVGVDLCGDPKVRLLLSCARHLPACFAGDQCNVVVGKRRDGTHCKSFLSQQGG
jgi:adenosine deaminase